MLAIDCGRIKSFNRSAVLFTVAVQHHTNPRCLCSVDWPGLADVANWCPLGHVYAWYWLPGAARIWHCVLCWCVCTVLVYWLCCVGVYCTGMVYRLCCVGVYCTGMVYWLSLEGTTVCTVHLGCGLEEKLQALCS